MITKTNSINIGLFLLLTVFFASCGGGGGGANDVVDFGLSGTGFGFQPNFGNTGGNGTSNNYPILNAVNIPVILYFNEDIDPTTVNGKSIDIRTIDVPAWQDPQGLVKVQSGVTASVEFKVEGSTLYIDPITSFVNSEPEFGYLPHACYEIKFSQSPDTNVVKSVSGRPIIVPNKGKPIAFITIDKIFDRYGDNPGDPPIPTFYIFDSNLPGSDKWAELTFDGSKGNISGNNIEDSPQIPVQPLPFFKVSFNEPVLLTVGENPEFKLVNLADFTSDVLSVFYYQDFPSCYDPVFVPGKWEISQGYNKENKIETNLFFTPNPYLVTLPTRFPDPEYIFLDVNGFVSDLAGNLKESADTRTLGAVGDPILSDITESFDDQNYVDLEATSASWGVEIEGPPTIFKNYLIGGGGGGDGSNGEFEPPTLVPSYFEVPGIDVDVANSIVYLPTSVATVQYVYNFTSFHIPLGWTVKAIKGVQGDIAYPLIINATGIVNIEGTLDVSGPDGEDSVVGVDPEGSAGGKSYSGGFTGGQGASIPADGDGKTLGLNWEFYDSQSNLIFQDPGLSDEDVIGITGLSTSIGDYWFEDTSVNFRNIETTITGQMLQPNVGMGEGNNVVATNHPIFYVEKVDPVDDHKIWVYSNPSDDKYRGKLNALSLNPGLPPPPIAKAGDPYLIGYLRGFEGEDGTVFNRFGYGGDPMTVAQTMLTLASAGGGGGAGNSTTGSIGMHGPDFNISLGGFSTPDSLGGNGGKVGFFIGSTVDVIDDVTIKIDKDLTGIDLTGYRINPNTYDGSGSGDKTTNDWIFTILSNTIDTLTVEILTDGVVFYNLNSTEVGADIGLPYLIYPPVSIGGAGGGGSGVECTGTYKTTYQPEYQLPRWLNGAGGGAGGGVLIMETAQKITVSPSGQILAKGGRGGDLEGMQVSLPGGGGGSGGLLVLRAANGVFVSPGGFISAEGGEGGGTDVQGGKGGDGYIRMENIQNDMVVNSFDGGRTVPAVEEYDLGKFLPVGKESLAQSKFYAAGVIKPEFTGVEIQYAMFVNDTIEHDLVYKMDVGGTPTGTYLDPPFELKMNSAPSIPKTGYLDVSLKTDTFISFEDFLNKPENYLFWLRFKMILFTEKTVGSDVYKHPRIERIIFKRVQQ